MSFRVPPDLKLSMDRAAADSGRSTAQEIELRLQQSFRDEQLLPVLLAGAYGQEVAGLLLWLGACLRRTLFVAEAAVRQSGDAPNSYLEHPWTNRHITQVLEQVASRVKVPGEPVAPQSLDDLPPDQRDYYAAYGVHTVTWSLLTLLDENSKATDLAPHTAKIRQCLLATVERMKEQEKARLIRMKEEHDVRQRRSPRQK